jgi:hypothetical protein
MAELTRANLFDSAFDATSAGIKRAGFAATGPWDKLVPKLREVVGDAGFKRTGHQALTKLREEVEAAAKKKVDEGAFLAAGAGIDTTGPGNAMATAEEVSRAAALKLLRHTHYRARRHNHRMWIVSLPESYTHWPHKHFVGSKVQLVTKLAAGNPRFSEGDIKKMADATQRGLRWVHSAMVVIDDLADGRRAMRLLKRWFADETTTAEELRTFAKGDLRAGLKKIAARMSSGSMIVTDFVPIRASNDADDMSFAGANAFVWADKVDAVYIEKPFFQHSASSVFQKDERHWSRIMVHEMSHRAIGTKDHRYGWAGIRPQAGVITGAQARENADSWALFVANAAGAMSKSDVKRALDGT